MASTGELLKQAAGSKWNPYYLAYAIETGAADPKAAFERDGNGARFMAWNLERWSETSKRLGLRPGALRAHYVAEHMETLGARIADKLTPAEFAALVADAA